MDNKKLAEQYRLTLEYIEKNMKIVQTDGPCPICKAGRNQFGECHFGHIIFVDFKATENPAPERGEGV